MHLGRDPSVSISNTLPNVTDTAEVGYLFGFDLF